MFHLNLQIQGIQVVPTGSDRQGFHHLHQGMQHLGLMLVEEWVLEQCWVLMASGLMFHLKLQTQGFQVVPTSTAGQGLLRLQVHQWVQHLGLALVDRWVLEQRWVQPQGSVDQWVTVQSLMGIVQVLLLLLVQVQVWAGLLWRHVP